MSRYKVRVQTDMAPEMVERIEEEMHLPPKRYRHRTTFIEDAINRFFQSRQRARRKAGKEEK